MAIRKVNGRASRVAPVFDTRFVVAQAEQVTAAAGLISRITEEVAAGSESQIRSLDSAVAGVTEVAASLKQTAGQADSVAVSAEQLLSSVRSEERRVGTE